MKYPYRCVSCGHTFTVRKPMSQAGEVERCPQCDYPAERVFAAPQRPLIHGGTPLHHGKDDR